MPKKCVTCGSAETGYSVHFLYTTDELQVTPGETYRAELRWFPYKEKAVTEGAPEAVPMDLRPWIYGDVHPGALPAIHNLRASFEGKGNMTLLAGWEPDAGLEADIDLPDGYVATGFGARIAPEWDVKTLALWGRPLMPDGSFGAEKEFRGGIQPEGGLEAQVRLEDGRVLSSAGLRCSLNDVKGIRATSVRLIATAAATQ